MVVASNSKRFNAVYTLGSGFIGQGGLRAFGAVLGGLVAMFTGGGGVVVVQCFLNGLSEISGSSEVQAGFSQVACVARVCADGLSYGAGFFRIKMAGGPGPSDPVYY